MASAVSRMSCSLTSQAKWFQLFHPMGGVRARPLLRGVVWRVCRISNAERDSRTMEPAGTERDMAVTSRPKHIPRSAVPRFHLIEELIRPANQLFHGFAVAGIH